MTTGREKRTRRRRLRIVVLAAVAMCVAAGAFVWWLWFRGSGPPSGFVVAVRAVDANSAVVVWRNNEDGHPPRSFVGRVDADGKVRWWRELPGVASTIAARDGLAVGDGVVTVPYVHDYDAFRPLGSAMTAFAIADGALLWDVVLSEGPQPKQGLYVASLLAGGRALHVAMQGEDALLYAVDVSTGEIVWQQPTSVTATAPMIAGNRLILHKTLTATSIDLTTGDSADLGTRGTGCIVGDEYVALRWRGDESVLVALAVARPVVARDIRRPFIPLGPHRGFHIGGCGVYGEQLVFFVTHRGIDPSDDASHVVVTDKNGAVAHTISLANDMADPGHHTNEMPEAAPFRGTLTRFVPYIVIPPHADLDVSYIAMLDLAEGRIAWQSPPDSRWRRGDVFRAGHRWYLHQSGISPNLTVFDGTTGELEASVVLYSPHTIARVRADHVAEGTIWVTSDAWRSLEDPPIAVLDAVTLAPRTARAVEVRDNTADIRTVLGLDRAQQDAAP